MHHLEGPRNGTWVGSGEPAKIINAHDIAEVGARDSHELFDDLGISVHHPGQVAQFFAAHRSDDYCLMGPMLISWTRRFSPASGFWLLSNCSSPSPTDSMRPGAIPKGMSSAARIASARSWLSLRL